MARIVIPNCPHHVVHRGNRGEPVFLAPEHRATYRRWLRDYAEKYDLRIWAYCLMTNHVHLIVVPEREESLALGVGYAHRRYAQWLNWKEGWRGHLWAGRFYSAPMDEPHLWTAARYVETNPVRAGLASRAQDYPWSSAAAHALARYDALLSSDRPFPNPHAVGDWAEWLSAGTDDDTLKTIRHNTGTGRPLGSQEFIAALEQQTGRLFALQKRGRKRR